MDDDNLKRRVMFGVVGFCGTVMVLTIGCVLVRNSAGEWMGCFDFLITLGVACAAAGVGVVAAMMTES